jgi:polar amino acid transport system substrate-binding protein
MKKSGVPYKMEVLPWKRAYELVQSEKNTLIFSMGRNEKSENLFKWVGVVAPTKYYFWTLNTFPKK